MSPISNGILPYLSSGVSGVYSVFQMRSSIMITHAHFTFEACIKILKCTVQVDVRILYLSIRQKFRLSL
jgi:hypothetical protein